MERESVTRLERFLAVHLVLASGLLLPSCAVDAPLVDPASTLTTGAVIEAAEAAVDDLMEEAFDRLDLTVMQVAMEARATVSQASTNLKNVLSHAVDELDGQQRRAVSDLQTLTTVLQRELAKNAKDLVEPIRQDALLLLSVNSGYIRLSDGFAVEGAERIDFSLTGTALSRARIRDLSINGVAAEPTFSKRDDEEIVLRVSLREGPAAELMTAAEASGLPVEIPVAFALEECSWFGLICRKRREFILPGYVLPREVGAVRAVFVGDFDEDERRAKSVGPFRSRRAKSSWTSSRGRKVDTFTGRPDEGWRIDIESARVGFRLVSGTCSSRISGAVFRSMDEYLVTVRTVTATEREPSVTCRSDTTIVFDQVRTKTVRRTFETENETLRNGERTVVTLGDSAAVRNPRLAHIVVESELLRGGVRFIRRGEETDGIRVTYDPAVERTAYVDVAYVTGG